MGNINNKIRFSILLISIVFISIVTPNITYFNKNTAIKEENNHDDIINNFSENIRDSNGVIVSITYDPEILIDGDNNDNNWTWAVAQSWCSGSGTWGDPYIIDNLNLTDSDGLGGCLEIRDSKAYFIIQNCEFKNSTGEEGVYLFNVANGTIGVNNEFSNNRYGISLSESENCTIQGNTIKNCDRGIYYKPDSHNQSIINNNINECNFGIYVDDIYNITATGNSFSSCGIYLDDDDQQRLLSHNFDTSNTVNGRTLFYYKSKESFNVGDFTNTGQVILVNCSNAIITNVNVSYASQGFSLYESDDNIILNSNATNNEKNGIYCYRSENVTLSLNIANNNSGNGIYIRDNCQEFNISNNEVNNNENYGIYLYDTINSNISSNKIMYNDDSGIYLQYTENITLTDNEIIMGGVKIDGASNDDYDSHKIDTSNTVNGDVLYYYSKEKDLDVSKFSNAGQVILISCNDSTIFNQNISQVTRGFVLRWCENITINHCNSSFTDDAFRIISSNWCNISNSIANNNSNNGMYITESSNNNINGNEMNFNYQGLILDYCNDITISDNVIDKNFDTGISIWEGSNNAATNNTLCNNQEFGIFLNKGNIHNITRNSMFECGIYINDYDTIESMINNSIDDTNEVNGKPVYYYVHKKGLNANKNCSTNSSMCCFDTILSHLFLWRSSFLSHTGYRECCSVNYRKGA